jgi:hypothetical protein
MTARFTRLSAVLAVTIPFITANTAAGLDITVKAGKEPVAAGPLHTEPGSALDTAKQYQLVGIGAGRPAQVDAEGRLWWWQDGLAPGQAQRYHVAEASGASTAGGSLPIEVRQVTEELVMVFAGGEPFTVLNAKKGQPRVYLYPVLGPNGGRVTRDYPMKDNPVEKENKRQDHPHHRSFWSAHGDVRMPGLGKESANFWHDTKKEDQDYQELRRINRMVSGPVFGEIEAEIDWIASTGKRVFTETRTYRFFAVKDERMVDVQNVFHFTEGDVTFGDTKEGGIIALRLAVTMDEKGIDDGKIHGRMTNSNGQVGAKECWGKAANWCDYVGPVDGNTVGVAIMDHPKNYGHPSHWHIRDYGLYTANPFGLSQFEGKDKNGAHTWKKGEKTEFDYRVIIHKGDTEAAHIPAQWELYSDPPKVEVVTGK